MARDWQPAESVIKLRKQWLEKNGELDNSEESDDEPVGLGKKWPVLRRTEAGGIRHFGGPTLQNVR